MHRPLRVLALWLTLVVLIFSSFLVAAGSGPDDSHAGWATVGPGGPPVETVPSFTALPPTNVTVAPAFSTSAGEVTLGRTPPGQSMTVLVGLALSDPAGLAGRLSAEYAQGTPEYRHFETPTDLSEQYGPSPSTEVAAQSYFQRFGLSAVPSPDHLLLTVSGTAGRIASAFGTEFFDYRAPDGRTFASHPTSATLPSGIAWSGVFGLGNATSFAPESIGPLSSR